jgi:hypothetical protein
MYCCLMQCMYRYVQIGSPRHMIDAVKQTTDAVLDATGMCIAVVCFSDRQKTFCCSVLSIDMNS